MLKEFELRLLGKFQYTKRDWTYAKVVTMLGWLYFMIDSLSSQHLKPLPEGICNFFNCVPLNIPPYSYAVILFAVLLAALYIFDRYVLVVTLILAVTGAVVFSSDQFQHNSRYGL